jgi:hypothetical protein
MNAQRIQSLLAALNARIEDPLLSCQAHALLSELCAPDGAVGIADEAAFELLGSECYSEQLDGVTWYHIDNTSILLLLGTEAEEVADLMARTVRYLSRRELLEAHPENSNLVRRVAA